MKYRDDDLIFEAYRRSIIGEADNVSGSIPSMSTAQPPVSSANPTGPQPSSTYNPKKPLGQALPQIKVGPTTKNSAVGATRVLQNTYNSLQGQTDVNTAKAAATQALNSMGTYEKDLQVHAPLSKDIQNSQDVNTLQQMLGKYLQWTQGLSK